MDAAHGERDTEMQRCRHTSPPVAQAQAQAHAYSPAPRPPTLTFRACALHAAGRVHGVPKQAELGHPVPHDAAHDRPTVYTHTQAHGLQVVRHQHLLRRCHHGLGKAKDIIGVRAGVVLHLHVCVCVCVCVRACVRVCVRACVLLLLQLLQQLIIIMIMIIIIIITTIVSV